MKLKGFSRMQHELDKKMQDDLRQQLIAAKSRLREKQKLEAMLAESRSMLRHEQEKCRLLEMILSEEQADVDKLEGLSLAGIFYTIMGTRQERLETEKQELLAATLKVEECQVAVEDLSQDIEQLGTQLKSLHDAAATYQNLLQQKEATLVQSDSRHVRTLLEFAEAIADLAADRKELEEAIAAGNDALRSLERAESHLSSAEGMGTWDMIGGGTFVTLAKHSRIDSAKDESRSAQRRLRKFREELADADSRLHVSLDDISGFSTFADYFFDGLIADWVVQSKIQNASSACRSAISKVKSALGQCRNQIARVKTEIQKKESERQDLIEQA